jgi:hypothetical protein
MPETEHVVLPRHVVKRNLINQTTLKETGIKGSLPITVSDS